MVEELLSYSRCPLRSAGTTTTPAPWVAGRARIARIPAPGRAASYVAPSVTSGRGSCAAFAGSRGPIPTKSRLGGATSGTVRVVAGP